MLPCSYAVYIAIALIAFIAMFNASMLLCSHAPMLLLLCSMLLSYASIAAIAPVAAIAPLLLCSYAFMLSCFHAPMLTGLAVILVLQLAAVLAL